MSKRDKGISRELRKIIMETGEKVRLSDEELSE
jgi:hypothetical protein